MIVDHTDWQPIAAMVEELGGVKALDGAVKAGVAEVHEVTGAGGSTVLARHVTRRYRNKEMIDAGWMTIHQMAGRLGCTTRTVNNRVMMGDMERKIVPTGGGGTRSYVRVVK